MPKCTHLTLNEAKVPDCADMCSITAWPVAYVIDTLY